MNVHDLTTLDRTAHWIDELIDATRIRKPLYAVNNQLAADVTRKAKALRTSLQKLRDAAENPKPA